MQSQDVPRRANHVLHLILIIFLLILARVWYLSVIKHEVFQERAYRPQRKTLIEQAMRGTIQDRFGLPLAINKMQYNVAVCYDRIREIPLSIWIKNGKGKKIRVYKRRDYIRDFSHLLGTYLEMDPIQIEDLIHSQASIFPHTPFVIKEGIPETTYYKLRALEKNWVGLEAQRDTKRFYPQGKVGCDIIGYMGAINRHQYYAVAEEMKVLHEFLQQREEKLPIPLPKGFERADDVNSRYMELKEKVYTIHARVGKMGVERVFDEELRGFFGKKQIEMDANGRLIQELPGKKDPISGKELVLTLSSELQEFAESLLIQSEKDRQAHFHLAGKNHDLISPPWTQGGAIVAMVPQTGEVVALASYPRFDPNDFTHQNHRKIHEWLETSQYIANIWDGKVPLTKEFFYEENQDLTWDLFLDHVLSLKGKVREAIKNISCLKDGAKVLALAQSLMELSETRKLHAILQILYPEINGYTRSHLTIDTQEMQIIQERLNQECVSAIKQDLDPYLKAIKHHDDQLLFFDLLHLALDGSLFSEKLIEVVGKDSLSTYRTLCQAFAVIEEEVKSLVKALYHERIFPMWRKENFKAYLKEKREEEKAINSYQRPYTDYLTQAEAKLFAMFWETNKWNFLETFIFGTISKNCSLQPFSFHLIVKRQEIEKENVSFLTSLQLLTHRMQQLPHFLAIDYLKTMRPYYALTKPLWGHYYAFSKPYKDQILQDLALAFYPKNGRGFSQSHAYGQATTLGSIFKLVTGYEALKQDYLRNQKNPISTDALNPLTLYDACHPHMITDQGMVLGQTLGGDWITRQYKGGRLPRSHKSIGKVDFVKAMERSSNIYFSLLAGDVIDHPKSLYETTREFGFGSRTGIDLIGEIGGFVPDDIQDNRTGLYAFAIGQHSLVVTPLQTSLMLSAIANGGEVLKPQIAKPQGSLSTIEKQVRRTLFMPKEVQAKLFESLYHVVWGEKGPAQPYRIRTLYQNPKLIETYKSLKDQFIGKTSTAEFVYRPTLDREMAPLICKDIWFGAISFSHGEDHGFNPEKSIPELVVIVYLRFGDYGKEAAPIAAQIIKKWRDMTCSMNLKDKMVE